MNREEMFKDISIMGRVVYIIFAIDTYLRESAEYKNGTGFWKHCGHILSITVASMIMRICWSSVLPKRYWTSVMT